jgi:RNA-directed DNA polymerase
LLDVSREELDSALTHSRYRLRGVHKSRGGIRLIEIPSEALRVLQRRLLHRLLDHVPVHEATHGFVRDRSVHTHAAPHVGREIVIRLDLTDFFPAISGARVFLVFRSLGYNVRVSNALTALCVAQQTRRTLRESLRGMAMAADVNALLPRFGAMHLPQGAPTSPALANLCACMLDKRLDAWATGFGATYTRYADDLVFSGNSALAKSWRAFIATARVIIAEEGWELNVHKTRVMRRSVRQCFTGLVVNARVNVARDEYDALKASVHRFCKVPQPDELSTLLGRIAWLGQAHPGRAQKLRAKLFAATHVLMNTPIAGM